MRSKTDNNNLGCDIPYTNGDNPKHANVCRSRELPIKVKSVADMVGPKQDIPNTKIDKPKSMELLGNKEDSEVM